MQALLPLFANLFRLLITKLLLAFGIAFVSYKGYDVALNQFKNYISNNMNNMPVDIANILLMAGFGEGLGYLFGAIAFAITMKTINKTLSFGHEK